MAEHLSLSGLDLLAEAAVGSIESKAAVSGHTDVLRLIDFDDPPKSSCRDGATDWDRERPEVRRTNSTRERDALDVDDRCEQQRCTSPVARGYGIRQRSPSPSSDPNRHTNRPQSPIRETNVGTHRTAYRGRTYEFPGYSVGAKLGTYDGSKCFETFLAKFRNCAEYFGWNTKDQLFHLKASLDGTAGQVLWDIPENITVERLIDILRNRFGTQNQAERYRAELRKRKRRRNESLQSLYQDICRLMSLAYPGPTSSLSEVVARDAFLEALDNPQLRIRILEREPGTLDEVLRIASHYEALERDNDQETSDKWGNHDRNQRRDTRHVRATTGGESVDHALTKQMEDLRKTLADYQQQVSETRSELEQLRGAYSADSTVLQFPYGYGNMPPGYGIVPPNIQTNGTDRTRYWQQPTMDSGGHGQQTPRHAGNKGKLDSDTCRKCLQQGHWARNCPQSEKRKNTEANGTRPNLQSVTNITRGTEVYLDAVVYGRRVSILLDTGCETSVIGENLLPKLHLDETEHRLYAANGTSIPILGETTIEFEVQNETMTTTIVVSPALSEMILGIDFLTANRCRWDFGHGLIELGGRWIRLQSRTPRGAVRRIRSESSMTIPAWHQANVPVKVMWSNLRPVAENCVVEPRVFTDGVMSGRTLLDGNTFRSVIPVMNLADRDYEIYQGASFGETESVTTDEQHVEQNDLDGVSEAGHVPAEDNTSQLNDRIGGSVPPDCLRERLYHTDNQPQSDDTHVTCVIDALPNDLTEDQRKTAVTLIKRNEALFSKSEFDIGHTSLTEHKIDTGVNRPFKQQLRRHPLGHLPIVDDHVDNMLQHGIVSPCISEWASNVILVRKTDQTWRFCVDMRKLNSLTLKDTYPLPRVDSCLDSLGGAAYFSSLDLRQGYWQVGMEEQSSLKTAFVTRRGVFKFNVLPYGLCNAPATFQRLMDLVLSGLTWTTCLVYLDDVVVFSSTFDDHVLRLQQVFDRLKQANLKLKASKCRLFQRKIKFLGSIVSQEGIAPDPTKVEAVVRWPIPTNLTEVRSFTALAAYYRKFVKGFAAIAKPLFELTQKGRPFVWTSRQQDAFEQLKKCLTEAPVLAAPLESGQYWLDTDASDTALGAVLQQMQNGELKVIAYASRVLTRSERSYSVSKREQLAVVYGLKQFRHFLLARHFILRVDHAALTYLLKTPQPVGQSARWLDLISEYDFEIHHRAGSQHGNADSLSRRPTEQERSLSDDRVAIIRDRQVRRYLCRTQLNETEKNWVLNDIMTIPRRLAGKIRQNIQKCGADDESVASRVDLDEAETEVKYLHAARKVGDIPGGEPLQLSSDRVRDEQRKDPVISEVIVWMERSAQQPAWSDIAMCHVEIQHLWSNWATLELKNGILYRQIQDADGAVDHYQLIVPSSLRTSVLTLIHANVTAGHLGIKKTQERLRQYAYWRGWKRDTELFVKRCLKCNQYRHTFQYKQGPMQSLPVCTIMQRLQCDLMGPFVRSRHYKYLLSAICPFSKYLVSVPLPDKSATAVAKALVRHVFLVYGAVEFCFTDMGGEFNNEVLSNVCRLLGIQKSTTTGYRPNSDGAVEKVQAVISSIFAKTIKADQKNWSEMVPYVAFAYNTAVHSVTGYSPFYLMFNRQPITGIDWQLEQPSPAIFTNLDEFSATMLERTRKAHAIVAEQLRCAFERNKTRYDQRVKSVQFEVGDFVWYFSPRKKPGLCGKWQLRTCGPYRVERRVNQVNYVVRKSPKAIPFICHIDRLRKFNGELPKRWKLAENVPTQSDPLQQWNVPAPVTPADYSSTQPGNIPVRNRPARIRRKPSRFRV